MNRDLHCPYSILDADIICEHKVARIIQPNTVTLHDHDGYEFILFLTGDVHLFVESEEMKLERGDLVIIPPYCFHGMRVTNIENYERIVLNLRPHILEEIGDKDTDFTDALHCEQKNKLHYVTFADNLLAEMISKLDHLEEALRKNSFGHSVLVKAYLAEFMVTLTNLTKQRSTSEYENSMAPTVKRVFNFIDENIYNELNVEIVARELHYNRDYLGRIFKDAIGGSLKYYINAKKIAIAQQLLRDGYPPYDVCFMLSFNNYSSFSRCFSQHIGLSPKQYALSVKRSPSFVT